MIVGADVPLHKKVSILILLEVPLQPLYSHCNSVLDTCFNPYFTGSTTSTAQTVAQYGKPIKFQSLFYWKYHFNNVMGFT